MEVHEILENASLSKNINTIYSLWLRALDKTLHINLTDNQIKLKMFL